MKEPARRLPCAIKTHIKVVAQIRPERASKPASLWISSKERKMYKNKNMSKLNAASNLNHLPFLKTTPEAFFKIMKKPTKRSVES